MSNAEPLLARLEDVRRSGRGWIARCPAHKDRSPSLSIAEGDDGRILLRCFGGCAANDVVAALGLELADLFPERLRADTPAQRRQMREAARQSEWRAALHVLSLESAVLTASAAALNAGQTLSTADLARLQLAAQRIDDARVVLS